MVLFLRFCHFNGFFTHTNLLLSHRAMPLKKTEKALRRRFPARFVRYIWGKVLSLCMPSDIRRAGRWIPLHAVVLTADTQHNHNRHIYQTCNYNQNFL